MSKPASFAHRETTVVALTILLLGMTQSYSMLLKLIVSYHHNPLPLPIQDAVLIGSRILLIISCHILGRQ
jgi:hypothetical protein